MEDFKDVKSGYSITFVSVTFYLGHLVPFSKGDLYLLLFSLLFEMLHMVYTFLLCIKFQNFNLNPYFEDTKLTKTFMLCYININPAATDKMM